MSNLVELSRRVSEAEGPDKALDADIFEACGGLAWDTALMLAESLIIRGSETEISDAEFARKYYSPNYTESLDEVAALIAEKLPDWDGYCDTGPNLTQYKAGMGSPGRALNNPRCDIWATGKTECLARLSAALLAIHESEKAK